MDYMFFWNTDPITCWIEFAANITWNVDNKFVRHVWWVGYVFLSFSITPRMLHSIKNVTRFGKETYLVSKLCILHWFQILCSLRHAWVHLNNVMNCMSWTSFTNINSWKLKHIFTNWLDSSFIVLRYIGLIPYSVSCN